MINEKAALAGGPLPVVSLAAGKIDTEFTLTPTVDQDSRRDFVLAAIRAAVLRVRLIEHELTAAGVALRGGFISPEVALDWAENVAPGCLCFVPDILAADGVAA